MNEDQKKKFLAGLSNLYSRAQIVADPSPLKGKRGFNLWFFKEIPGDTPTDGCFKKDGLTLLFIGISPAREDSHHDLYGRIYKNHCTAKAKFSTLRTSLGVLLAEESGYPLRVGNVMTFTRDGEDWLNDWMDKNAFVCWYEHKAPWEIKEQVITAFSTPLNIQDGTHPFRKILKGRRVEAKRLAREMPIVYED